MSESQLVLYERRDAVVTITLNHPQSMNALSDDGPIDALRDALVRLNSDKDARVAILTGAGEAFSAGGNLRKFAADGGVSNRPPLDIREFFRGGIIQVVNAFEALEVPIIAAVNGPAYGGGFGIALLCDMRIASENARFCEVFTKLGLVPADGDAWLLPRLIGFANAAELFFTGEPIGPERALLMGIVQQVVKAQELMPTSLALANRIAANAPHGLRMTKRLMKEGQRTDLRSNLETAASMMAILHRSADHHAALNGFIQKKKAVFTGS